MTFRALRRIKFFSHLAIAVALTTIVLFEYVRPWVTNTLYKDEYIKLTLACDHAMHDEAALRTLETETEKQKLMMVSADVGLLVCHEYDKLRKIMLIGGVTDDQLALHGLEALEIEKIPVSQMADPHRMPRF